MDVDRARSLIRRLSDLPAREVELLGAGTDSAAFRVDSEWVVRFPLVVEAQATLSTELALLPELVGELPIGVPCPEHVGERAGEIVFAAYRALEGEPFSDRAMMALSPSARARALDELADVIDGIHRFPFDRARAAGVSFELCKGAYHAAQEALEREFGGALDPPERAVISRQRQEFERAQAGVSTPVLLHSDIKPEHLLHDPATGELTGLLDWGDVSLGDGDFDLAIVGAFCGPRTLEGLLDRLDGSAAERVRASVPFLLTVRRLQDAHYAAARGADAAPFIRTLREHLRGDASKATLRRSS